MAFNCTTKVTGGPGKRVLTITIDLDKEGRASKSGKSIVIGSTEGNTVDAGAPEVKIGVNVYRSA